MSQPISIQAHPDLVLDLQDGGVRQIFYKGVPMLLTDLSLYDKPNPYYYGQFVAPLAGRVKEAKLGDFSFVPNEKGNALHGANYSLCWKEYQRSIFVNSTEICVEFTRNDTYFGSPCTAKARFYLDRKRPKFRMELSFVCDCDAPMNLTNHCYFNLGEQNLGNVFVKIPASHVMSYDKELIPLGYVPVSGRFDLRKPTHLPYPLDHAFCLEKNEVKAWSDKVGLVVKSNAKNVLIFVGPFLEKGGQNKKGFTLEFLHFPGYGKEMILPAKTEHLLVNEYEFFAR